MNSFLMNVRNYLLVKFMLFMSKGKKKTNLGGIYLSLYPGICNPGSFSFTSFVSFYQLAVATMSFGQDVCEIGTGSGIWALLATQKGASVTATELPNITFDALRESAKLNHLVMPKTFHGHLFEPLNGQKYDHVLFNPPFHFGKPRSVREQAYFGGENGEIVGEFLDKLHLFLKDSGQGHIIIPVLEKKLYEDHLSRYIVTVSARRWFPLMGSVELLTLCSPKHNDTAVIKKSDQS